MKVLLATPAYGGNVTDLYMRSVIGLLHSGYARGVQIDVLAQTGESLITRARNDILATFVAGDWTHLLWVDADIGFEPDNVWRLLDSGHDVTATGYPLKQLDWDAVSVMDTAEEAKAASVSTVINFAEGAKLDEQGFAPALDAGTGFMLVSRDALELLMAYYPELRYDAEGDAGERYALFDTMLENGRYLSEDYAFCRRWQNIGGEVMVDLNGPALQHRGYYTYGG